MSVAILIPARYASTRFPGKPLVPLTGATGATKTLIERTWDVAQSVPDVDHVAVTTDDTRIQEAAAAFGADVLMTSSDCRNGTERCAEALAQLTPEPEIVVNLQGDAPLTPPWFIPALIEGLRASDAAMATPVLKCSGRMVEDLREDRRAGRVGATTAVMRPNNHAIYFSKEVLPFSSASYADDDDTPVYHHVGIYAYRPDALRQYLALPEGQLEKLEGLEQLRFLEAGADVLCVEVEMHGRSFWELNNPSDVPRIEAMLKVSGTP